MPRYCIEDVEYLKIISDQLVFKEIAVLQKCFCDIPIHKLADTFELQGSGSSFESLDQHEKSRIEKENSHTTFYGEYAIAFSKQWGENNNLQPIQYLNKDSSYCKELIKVLNNAISLEDIDDVYADDLLYRLSFVKPLRGIMKRQINTIDQRELSIEFYKNFHDENEWRFVPDLCELKKFNFDIVIADPNNVNLKGFLINLNKSLMNIKHESIWLKFNYDDIRYIIVPDSKSRTELINIIIDIPDNKFNDQDNVVNQKYLMISKILVLTEIRKDW